MSEIPEPVQKLMERMVPLQELLTRYQHWQTQVDALRYSGARRLLSLIKISVNTGPKDKKDLYWDLLESFADQNAAPSRFDIDLDSLNVDLKELTSQPSFENILAVRAVTERLQRLADRKERPSTPDFDIVRAGEIAASLKPWIVANPIPDQDIMSAELLKLGHGQTILRWIKDAYVDYKRRMSCYKDESQDFAP
ncbi:hypothetical protein HNP46_006334 [Pseudomonas nitritireducens]|uniref:Uncharacterized protein n=1 Tax=Pseudomonas nitroreducens TaxID=46680 RepID=A0A7W7KRL5_PSENT|nr:hypothetical protein [Pseudomonas nitritireducens]MBB4867421.1 hypothetical protein [Pseudomonas nitritireducens]